ncbi:MAG: hypothetical protein FH751_12710 [Firmicutes bacterium]|nr:hypothetical protein [Bacillota bacterium]
MIDILWLIFLGAIIYQVILTYSDRKKHKELLQSENVTDKIERVDKFLKEIKNAKSNYIVYTFKSNIYSKFKDTYDFFTKKPYSKIKKENIIEFKDIWENIDTYIKQWNEEYVQNELNKNSDLFDNIDGKSLDKQQRRAIVVDEMNNLILAGAGSGKTLTISGKVKYLVERKDISPQDILLISFTRKAADEMYQRISQKLNVEVDVKTFHKLGLDIITKRNKQRPDISQDMKRLIDNYFKHNIYNDKNMITKVIIFFGYYLNIPKEWEEFENLGEYHDYYRNIDFQTLRSKAQVEENIDEGINDLKINKQTLQGEAVKSLEEVIIANFLFLNGINYIYEHPYPYNSSDPYRKRYEPDFYLPDYDIYLEHFGISEDGRVPWLTKIEEEKYLEGIKWKREMHKKNETSLLETYSYYNKNGVLLKKLEKMLKKQGVKFKEVNYEEVFNRVYDQQKDRYFEEFKKLVGSFIGLFKSNGYTLEKFTQFRKEAGSISNTFLRERSKLFLEIVEPVYEHYQEFLKNNKKIDFNDMINFATEIIESNLYNVDYKYIIIDEYQDISASRYKLIKAIRDMTNAKVMCVGDDWQSIYRFAGSDIDLFTNFSKYFGYSEVLKIEKTYRNSQQLINTAGKFIMKNEKQLMKDLRSDKQHSNPIRIFGYERDIFTALKKAIDEIVHLFGNDTKILLLGRNNFDIEFIASHEDFELIKNSKGQVKVKYRQYPKLKLPFLTAHRSKGLEADNVIIINAANKLLGFPNKISDDPLLSLVLTDLDSFPFAEERRLFYVAITRTKNTTYILAPDKKPSIFVDELIKDEKVKYEFSTNENSIQENPNCPKCQKGYLILRKNTKTNRAFLGCTNYPHCDLTIKNVEILNDQIKCRSCGGYMVKRKGRYGEFYGCTNYPFCTQTVRIESKRSS